MEQTVYVDLFFLINFSMDMLGLILASRLLSRSISLPRIILASAFGALYACVSLFWGLSNFFDVLIDIFAGFVIGVIAIMKKRNIRDVLGFSIVYTAVSIVLGGFMTALFSIFNRLKIDKLFDGAEGGDGISVWLFALLAFISGVLSLLGGRLFRKRSSRKEGMLCVSFNKRSVTLRAICDSGNLLKEPISAKMCIVVDTESVLSILPNNARDKIREGKEIDTSCGIAQRMRVIPISTVSGEGILYAFRPDSVKINMGNGWSEVDVYIAFGEINKGSDGAEALIPSEIAFGVS